MLSFFKSNNPAVVTFYIVYLVLFRVYVLFLSPDSDFVFEHHEPLSGFLFALLTHLPLKFYIVSITLSGLLSFVQALLINKIVNENKIIPRRTYMPGALFIIFSSFFKESLLLTPASVAFTFLILCIAKTFSLIRKEKSNTDIFDAGFLTAIASFFYFPSILFVLFIFIAVAVIRPYSIREGVILFLGALSPFIVLFTAYYWNDETSTLLRSIAGVASNSWVGVKTINKTDWVLLGSISLITLTLFTMLPNSLYSSLIQVRKFSTVLVLFVLFTVLSFSILKTVNLSHFALLGLPLGIISSMVLTQIKRKLIVEVVHLILILLVLAGQYLPLFIIL